MVWAETISDAVSGAAGGVEAVNISGRRLRHRARGAQWEGAGT
jgi:hypothetical protein